MESQIDIDQPCICRALNKRSARHRSKCQKKIWRSDEIDIDLSLTGVLFRLQRRVSYYLFDLILLGCVADPVIYAARMRQVRCGYVRIWNVLTGRVIPRWVREPLASCTRGAAAHRTNEASSSTTTAGRTRRSINVVSRLTSGGNDTFMMSAI